MCPLTPFEPLPNRNKFPALCVRDDGKELFYLTPNDEVMAVSINTESATFQPGVPKPLFQAGSWTGFCETATP